MKLLSWMNRKVKCNTTGSLKTFSIEDYAGFHHDTFGEQSQHADPTFSFTNLKQPNNICQSFATDIKSNKVEDINEGESFKELFQGFLAIGTLGSEPLDTEPPTPTFPKTFEDTTNEEMCITENELELINDKLEKLLQAEAEEVANRTSERSSHGSIITLSNDQTEESNAEDHGNMKKKEKTSLGELFKRNRVHEHLEETPENEKKQAKGRCATHFMKKMLRRLHSAPRTSKAPNGDTGNCASIKSKIPKILKIFHKQVHPEGLGAEEKLTKPYANMIEKILCKCGNQDEPHQENTGLPSRANPTALEQDSSAPFTATTEHWIKTDAEYLVLEL